MLIHVDCSESYSSVQQDEIQSAYFGHQNFSIFTSCSSYRQKELADLATVPVNVINKSSEHSQIAMCTCITVVSQIKDQMNEALSKKCDGKNLWKFVLCRKNVFTQKLSNTC